MNTALKYDSSPNFCNPLEELAKKDLHGKISPDESAKLNNDLPAWHRTLISIIQDIDRQLSTRKLDVSGGVPDAEWEEYCRWRTSALFFKKLATEKARAVKALITSNFRTSEPSPTVRILGEILEEVRAIADIIQDGPYDRDPVLLRPRNPVQGDYE
jgi:hypothetical protein